MSRRVSSSLVSEVVMLVGAALVAFAYTPSYVVVLAVLKGKMDRLEC